MADAEGTFDDENLESSQAIRAEIEQVEAEGRRLLDAFNGLELSTLTKRHRRAPMLTTAVHGDQLNESSQSKWTIVPETRSIGKGEDGMSVHSGRSVGTTKSGTKSLLSTRGTQSSRMLPTSGPPPSSRPPSVTRKSSFSSTSSRGTNYVPTSPIPPVPGLPRMHASRSNGHLKLAPVEEGGGNVQLLSPSNTTLQDDAVSTWSGRGGGRAGGGGEEDVDIRATEKELGDIRRRRAEVTARYDARLEYLRAKLKGAELRERLLKS
ncbi:hypothetical protein OE88DRAFT_1663728 [Heliocybe sulcata]|uniref:Uncharacterized protein n=1 Tax=Heliocybe sulcata TaxID=5364 RepID=A0A5C3MY25_9AGAM|nr:hypothetical protein OE88DRAFT_1663728 [Heliocybe sulcata]